jgi:hypothetical protein
VLAEKCFPSEAIESVPVPDNKCSACSATWMTSPNFDIAVVDLGFGNFDIAVVDLGFGRKWRHFDSFPLLNRLGPDVRRSA